MLFPASALAPLDVMYEQVEAVRVERQVMPLPHSSPESATRRRSIASGSRMSLLARPAAAR